MGVTLWHFLLFMVHQSFEILNALFEISGFKISTGSIYSGFCDTQT